MKHTDIKVLDENDMEFIEALRSLDVPRNVAMLITFLANVSEASSREIEMATGMRQPEVSIAMRTLRKIIGSQSARSRQREKVGP